MSDFQNDLPRCPAPGCFEPLPDECAPSLYLPAGTGGETYEFCSLQCLHLWTGRTRRDPYFVAWW